ncbi:hypothetical protein CEXT_391871, partial [Caerostris extrusa]
MPLSVHKESQIEIVLAQLFRGLDQQQIILDRSQQKNLQKDSHLFSIPKAAQ